MNWQFLIEDSKVINNHYWGRYLKLVDIAHNRQRIEGYTEKHHIWPKSLGGPNVNWNYIELTAREHFIAHWLLAKALGGGMYIALWNMCNVKRFGRLNLKINSRLYESSRIMAAEESRVRMIQHNPFKGKKHTNESLEKIRDHSRRICSSPEYRKNQFKQAWHKMPSRWIEAQEIYNNWLKYGKPKSIRLGELLGITYDLDYMLDRFIGRRNWSGFGEWVPNEDKDWVEFYSAHGPAKVIVVDETKHKELIELINSGRRHSIATRNKMSKKTIGG